MEIPFGMTVMIQQNDLLFWKTDYNSIDIFKINLENLEDGYDQLHDTIPINISSNNYGFTPTIELTDFVTYVRMDELKYEMEYYEKFAIVIIDKLHIQVIPFDSFNKTGGDYGYVWPALAQLDLSALKIHGVGMRMSNFIVDLSNRS
jgi:hypothetical protein